MKMVICKKCGIEFEAYDNFCQHCPTPPKRTELPEQILNRRFHLFHYKYDGGKDYGNYNRPMSAHELMIITVQTNIAVQAMKFRGETPPIIEVDENYGDLINRHETIGYSGADNKPLAKHILMSIFKSSPEGQDTIWVADTWHKTIEMVRGVYVPKNFMEKYFVGYTYSPTREFGCNILHKMSVGLLPGDIFFIKKIFILL